MGIDVDTLGNHNFDRGVGRLRALMAHARFPYVAANIVAADGTRLVPPAWLTTLHGIKVGIVGIGNPETPAVVAVGRAGEFQFFPPVPAMNAEARAVRARGAEVVIVLAHVGAIAVAPDGTPRGAIVEMARGARGVDVLIGDHTDMTVNTVINGVLVVENRSKGVEYAVVTVDYDRRARAVVGRGRGRLPRGLPIQQRGGHVSRQRAHVVGGPRERRQSGSLGRRPIPERGRTVLAGLGPALHVRSAPAARPPRRGRDANGRRFHRAGRHRVHRGDERLRLQRGRWLRDAGERDGRAARVDRRDDQPRGPRPRTRDRHRRRPHHGRAVMWRVAQLPFSRRTMSARVAGDAQSWGPTPRASSRPWRSTKYTVGGPNTP